MGGWWVQLLLRLLEVSSLSTYLGTVLGGGRGRYIVLFIECKWHRHLLVWSLLLGAVLGRETGRGGLLFIECVWHKRATFVYGRGGAVV